MAQNVAVFLDLDNLVIGARQANLIFNIHHILNHVQKETNGRIVLRRAYGDSQQNRELVRELMAAGFVTQVNLSINNYGKNLADMQITVDAMESLVDERPYHVYVLITGDQDFSPLAQALRKRDKYVIGIGVKHSASSAFASLCDKYLFYEEIVPTASLDGIQVEKLLQESLSHLEKSMERVRASVLKQRIDELSQGSFSNSRFAEGSFRKFLENYPHLLQIEQDGTTTYVTAVRQPASQAPPPATELHLAYRARLKKQRLRVVPAGQRLLLLKEMVDLLRQQPYEWRALSRSLLVICEQKGHDAISKNVINAVLLLAREAGVIYVNQGNSLALSPVALALRGEKLFAKAVVLCDRAYLARLRKLEEPLDLTAAALALYDTPRHTPYLQRILPQEIS